MKNFILYSISFLLMLILFLVSSQSIIGAKLLELRLNIQKDQVMNYELSSKALKDKLRQVFIDRENFENEIKLNVLESSILNSNLKEFKFKLSFEENLGLLLVNTVRFFSLKPPLELETNQTNTLLLQYAFFQERSRRYKLASDKYNDLEKKLKSKSEEIAFVYLHNGFCLAMQGQIDESYTKLRNVVEFFPGTHYAENANLLIIFLKENEKNKKSIQNIKSNPLLYTKRLYENGNYEETLSEISKLPKLTKDLTFVKARSLEELGKTSHAIDEYLPLSKQQENKEIAIKANRRLMLLSNYYEENKELSDISKKNAVSLGDSNAIQTVEKGKEFKQEAKVLEAIQIIDNSDINLASIKEEIVQEIKIIKDVDKKSKTEIIKNEKSIVLLKEKRIDFKKIDTKLENNLSEKSNSENKKLDSITIPSLDLFEPKIFDLVLRDERILSGNELELEGEFIKIITSKFPIKTNIDNVDRIQINIPDKKRINNPLTLYLKNGKIHKASKILIKNKKWIIEYSNERGEIKNNSFSENSIDRIKI
jgi:hypothetical protein